MGKKMGIATKISIMSAVCMFIAAVIIQIAFLSSFKSTMYQQEEQSLSIQAIEESEKINEWLVGQADRLSAIGTAMEFNNNVNHEYLMDYLEKCLNENEYALMYYICFAYDKSVNPADHSSLDLDPTERGWWKAAVEKGDVIFTDPYTDFATGKMVVSIAKPLEIDKKQAVLLADITIDCLLDMIDESSTNSRNELFLLAADGSVVTHPNKEYLPTKEGNTILSDKISFVTDSTEMQEIVDYNGVNKLLTIQTVKATDWKLGVLFERSIVENIINRTLMKNIVVLAVITLILSIVVAVILKQMIAPLTDAVVCLDAISKGDFNVKVRESKSQDEIGRLQRATSHLLKTLSNMVNESNKVLGAMASQNLRVRDMSSYEGDFDQMANSINQIKHIMSDLIKEIQIAASEVNTGAVELASASENLSCKTLEQANSIHAIEEHIHNIGNKIEYSSEKFKAADMQLEEMDRSIQLGHSEMTRLMELVNQIEEYSSEILQVVNAIDDISFQTNILALNASVEAARAGEVGKGFAVVSEEVRNLAYKAGEESNKTDDIIKNCIQAIKAVKEAAEDTFDCLKGVSSQSVATREAFHSIFEDTMSLSDSAKEMVRETETVSNAVESNMATSEETAASSSELSQHSATLENMVRGFDVSI